jgi:thiol:disulfide interchange protein
VLNIVKGMEVYLGSSPFMAIAAAFGGGVLVSLSPCVYPLFPIVSTYIGARSLGEKKRLKAFFLSLSYVVGMALVYAALGVFAGLTGSLFGQISTNPWAQLVVANIVILLGLNQLEVISLPTLPSPHSRKTKKKGLLGAFLVGAVSGLIASPCATPALGILLTYVGTRQSALFGGILLFAFALGMGLLLLVAGTFSGLLTTLPKPGKWMVWMKKILGFLMLALGEYFLFKAGQLWS